MGGGGSKVFAIVLRAVVESLSVKRLRLGDFACTDEDGGRAVRRESLGLLNSGGRLEGTTESMVSATCCRKSEVSGDSGRGVVEEERWLA